MRGRIVAGLLWLACASSANAAVINFDDLTGSGNFFAPTPVSNQYSSLGVVFSDPSGPVGASLGSTLQYSGYSSPNVLFAFQGQSDGDAGDLRLDFSVPVENVSWNAFLSESYYMTAMAYGYNGALLSSFTTSPVATFGDAMSVDITTSAPISYLLLTSQPTFLPGFYGNFGIDDLTFDSPVSATPLPAALPLFAGGLGILGVLGRRRKRKAAALAAA